MAPTVLSTTSLIFVYIIYNLKKLFNYMQRRDIIIAIAFTMGFFSRVKFDVETLNDPLSFVFDGGMYGLLVVFCASICIDMLPTVCLPVITILCGANIIYNKYNEYMLIISAS